MSNLSPDNQPSKLYDPVEDYLSRLERTVKRLSREEIWAVVQVMYRAWREGKQIFLIGNGGSAATASHLANDLNKLTIVESMPRLRQSRKPITCL